MPPRSGPLAFNLPPAGLSSWPHPLLGRVRIPLSFPDETATEGCPEGGVAVQSENDPFTVAVTPVNTVASGLRAGENFTDPENCVQDKE